ncbi:four-carbon acid sugar kinase family protein [Pseudarthrobacter sp. BRE9]|uniref:four-carbon acid sugar kinase family protein n=1 Tax=Pseudarthrobacter sp. BRE9 TaxID=2962582 RepID=UPI0028818412|nr:four-carbon acid sugar kinase family protein [Pseudarthrobacter sp. BRE9]MDT0169724.1 four-carbon acid sugar kinase family protein [Pseudarthrobacter sp. BRE9]
MNTNAAMRWAIIADDLTGAADAAAAYGPTHSSSVILDVDSTWPDAEILSINTESRYLAPAEAARAVTTAADRALGQHRRVFKKIDSLLRGNVGAEVAATLARLTQGRSKGLAVVAPAFPGTGRTTLGGIVHVNGAPHSKGNYDGDVAAALAAGGLTAEVAGTSGRTPEELARHLRDVQDRGIDAVVLDAVSDADLERIAAAAELLDFPALLVGSGGLAGHIAARENEKAARNAQVRRVSRTLTVIGSYSSLARQQTEALVAAGAEHITLDHDALEDPAVARKVAEAMTRNDVVLTPDPMGTIDKSQALVVAEALARATAAGIGHCDALVMTGGETATAVLKALGAGSFTVLGEIEPGVVVSLLPEPLPLLVTKAGAFGDAGTLARTTRFLTGTTTEMSIK